MNQGEDLVALNSKLLPYFWSSIVDWGEDLVASIHDCLQVSVRYGYESR